MPATGRYCDQGDLVPALMSERVLAQLTCDDGSAVTVDETLVVAWMAAAASEIDSYLGRRYSLPLSEVPELVTHLAARVTRYRAYMSRPGGAEDSITADYKSAIEQLKAIAKGELAIGLTPTGSSADGARKAVRIRSSSVASVFGRNATKGY